VISESVVYAQGLHSIRENRAAIRVISGNIRENDFHHLADTLCEDPLVKELEIGYVILTECMRILLSLE